MRLLVLSILFFITDLYSDERISGNSQREESFEVILESSDEFIGVLQHGTEDNKEEQGLHSFGSINHKDVGGPFATRGDKPENNGLNNNNNQKNSGKPGGISAGDIQSSCPNCNAGDVQTILSPPENPTNPEIKHIPVTGGDGHQVGRLEVPPSIATAAGGDIFLDVQFVQIDDFVIGSSKDTFSGTIMDILLQDDLGNEITELVDPLTICFEEDENAGARCLGFYNEYSYTWECEDENLKRVGGEICGETEHLTSFALLLGEREGSSSYDTFLAYLSLSFVFLALILISVTTIVIEIYFQYRKYKRKQSKFTIEQIVPTE